MTERIGEKLGKYRLMRTLGYGGFAEVYVGEHVFLGSQAAIKILSTSLKSEEIDSFQIEARRLANLTHPNIVRVLDFDVENSTPFLVMEYAPNGSLRDRHPKGSRLSLAQILIYVKQIASALQYLHDQKLIHRDVKPANILIGLDNKLLLSDIGIAVNAHGELSLSIQNVVGTPSYMSPEQFLGKPRPASDQYSLSVVIYEWLCGSTPFNGDFVQLGHQHSSVFPPSLHEKIPTISPDIEDIIMKALAKDHSQRFPRVQDFADTLELACQPRQSAHIESLPKSQLLLGGLQSQKTFGDEQYSVSQSGQASISSAQNNAKGQLPDFVQNNALDIYFSLQPETSLDITHSIAGKGQQSNFSKSNAIHQQNAYFPSPSVFYEGYIPGHLNEYSHRGFEQALKKKRGPKVGLIISMIVLMIFLVGGGFAEYIYNKSHSQNTNPDTPRHTIVVTPTSVPLFSDSFNTNNVGWDLTSYQGKFSVKVGGGSLVLEDDQNKLLWEIVPGKIFTDFRLDVDATLTKGDPNNGYGVLIRASNQGTDLGTYYRFELYGDGTYAIFKGYLDATGTTQSTKVQGYIVDPAIAKVGQVNHITIVAKGPAMSLMVNGQAIYTYTDDNYKGGSIALFVSNLPQLTPGTQATFTHLEIFPAPK